MQSGTEEHNLWCQDGNITAEKDDEVQENVSVLVSPVTSNQQIEEVITKQRSPSNPTPTLKPNGKIVKATHSATDVKEKEKTSHPPERSFSPVVFVKRYFNLM